MGRHDTTLKFASACTPLVRGLYGSTPVQTALGWFPAEGLAPGDLVMTKDEGLRPIVAIHTELRQALWSVRLPVEAVGNPEMILLPPGQPFLIKTAYAMPFSGDDLALVPATALEGWRGIAPLVPARTERVFRIMLERAGILFVGPGLMVGCEGVEDAAFDLKRLLDVPQRPTLPLAAARQLAAHLIADEAGGLLAGLPFAPEP